MTNSRLNQTSLTRIIKTFAGKYTSVGSQSTLHPRVANKDLSRHLGEDHLGHGIHLLTGSM